jgi:murein DD-endopeptidase MepM/ murein hydrolase activator NlpD
MSLISPTGNWNVRNDGAGQGSFGAPRGNRQHNGVDLLCAPGQVILSPISGQIVREAYPYAGDLKWSGCLIVGDRMEVKMFYMRLYHHLRKHFPESVYAGQPIGTAQDITNRYPDEEDMLPHIHLELKVPRRVDPLEYRV